MLNYGVGVEILVSHGITLSNNSYIYIYLYNICMQDAEISYVVDIDHYFPIRVVHNARDVDENI